MHPSGLKDSTVALLERSGWTMGNMYASSPRNVGLSWWAVYFFGDKELHISPVGAFRPSYIGNITDDEELIKLLYLKGLL
jgi:hypothetical protein